MYYSSDGDSPYQHKNPQHLSLDDVEKFTLADYGFTPDAIKANHFGIDVTHPKTGQLLPDAFYQSKIEIALAKVEKQLDIVLLPRVRTEHPDYYQGDYESNMFLHLERKPVLQVEKLQIELFNTSLRHLHPKWWNVYNRAGHLKVFPGARGLLASGMHGGAAFNGIEPTNPILAYANAHSPMNTDSAPQMFHVEYVAGMLPPKRRGVSDDLEMQPDMFEAVIKMALVEVYQQWQNLIASPGIAKISNDMDGISQTLETTQTAMYGAASANIEMLKADIAELIAGLRAFYGFNSGVI